MLSAKREGRRETWRARVELMVANGHHERMLKSPAEMMAAVEISMRERTGRSVAEWAELVAAESGIDPLDQNAVRKWLKAEHGLAQNSQWAIARRAAENAGWVEPSAEEYVEAMFSGKKASLRPLHDAAIALGLGIEGASLQSRSTYTTVIRTTQFLAVGPGSRGRARIGIRLREGEPVAPEFAPAKSFAQATHEAFVAPPDQGWPEDPAQTAIEAARLLAFAKADIETAARQN